MVSELMGFPMMSSAGRVESSDVAIGGGRLGNRLAQLLQCLLLDLSDPLGGEPEIRTDLAQRLRGLAEAVVAPQHRALALAEPVCELAHLLELQLVEHPLVLPLGARIGDRVAERRRRALVDAQWLLEAARRPIDRQQAVELRS